jgi:hypothetical protein
MNIRFSGITFYNGTDSKVSKKLDDVQEKDCSILTARLNNQGVALEGNDAEKFLKQFDIEMPNELKNISREKAMQVVSANPEKFQPLIEKLGEVASDVFGFIDKVFEYANAAKEKGQDADGKAIQEKNL